MSYLKDFQTRIDNNDYPGFLKIWEEYCYSDEFDPPEYISVLESVKKSSLVISFGNHVEKGLILWEKIKDTDHGSEILKLIFDIQSTNSENLLSIALTYLSNKYGEDPTFQDKLRLVGLRGSGESFQSCIRNFELLAHLKKGNFVFHSSGWGVGEIMDVSFLREEINLECEYTVGIKHLSFTNGFKTLIPLKKDHFLARRFGNPDLFEKQAKENPTEVIRCLLRDLGPKRASEIKEELCELVIPTADWNRWWQTARNKIKKDTKIESPKDLKHSFKLRKEEIPHEVTFYKALDAKPSIPETIQMVYTFLRDFPETLKNKEFKSSLEAKISEILNTGEIAVHERLQLQFFSHDLSGAKKEEKALEIIKNTEGIEPLINSIEVITFKKRALMLVKKVKEGWKELFLSMLFTVDQHLIRDYLLTELIKHADPKVLNEKISELYKHPTVYPEVYVWYFQKLLDKKAKIPFADRSGRAKFFEGLLILLDHLGRKIEDRDLAKKVISIILDHRYKCVRDVMAESTIEEVQEFILLATKCEILSDHDIKIIHSLAEVVYPALSKKSVEKEEEIIWTTKEGYQKTKERIERIATVETVENAKEIEEARSHGDLRENAEFKSALERRDRLQSELSLLSDLLNKARIISPSDIQGNTVEVGAVVNCKDSKGNKKQFTILGPWDIDPENNIISFQSKLAKAMKGKKVGDSFEFQNESFEIRDIQNFFDLK